ncbi:MAG: hypothetical protein Kow0062_15250 [Acidobacteriota bacterium]
MHNRGANLLAALALLACGLGPAAAVPPGETARRSGRTDYREWIHGPVRYIATRSEVRLFRRLDSPQEQLRFIRNFWERRDPDPRTAINEARVLFWQRVAEANRKFTGTARPGWKTDRGKIYILLGPPDDIEQDPYYDTRIQDVAARGLMRWIYYGLRHAPTSAVTAIAFVRTGDNDWRLSDDPRFASPTFNIYAMEGTSGLDLWHSLGGLGNFIDSVPWAGGTLGTAMDLGRLQEIPSSGELLRSVVRSEEFIGNYRGHVHAEVLHGAGGVPILALTAAVERRQLLPAWDGSATSLAQRLVATATLEPDDGAERAPVDIPEQAFVAEPRPADGDPFLRLQAVRPVPPGAWRVRVIVVDRRGGGAAVVESRVEIPEPAPEAPRVNGPILAAALHETPDRAPSGTRPWTMQGALVIPAMRDVIPTDRPVGVFIEIGPARGANGPVALDWRWERTPPGAQATEAYGRKGHLDDARGPRAWRFAPGELPPGRYTVRFVARGENGAETRRVLAFTITGPGDDPDAR